MQPSSSPLLEVQHLTTVFDVAGRALRAVDDVSFEVRKGETLGLVGESGSGKSLTAYSILRLVQPPGRIASGRVLFQGRDLLALPEREMRKVRGAGIALIFQEPMTALNPVFTVGDQIAEAMLVHGLATRAEAKRRAVELLDAVRVAEHRPRRDNPGADPRPAPRDARGVRPLDAAHLARPRDHRRQRRPHRRHVRRAPR